MSVAWELEMPATEKMVMLCLCDFANDNGDCWPAISTIARKCSLAERSVQRLLKSLVKKEYLSIERGGGRKNCNLYSIKTPTQCHPDTVSPIPVKGDIDDIKGDIDDIKPRHSVTRTIIEPSRTTKLNNTRATIVKPDGVEQDVWDDFLRHRKAKTKTPFSKTALAGINREAVKAGWSMNDALAEIVTRGWQGFKADWVLESKNDKRNRNIGSTEWAAKQAIHELSGGVGQFDDSAGTSGALPDGARHRTIDAMPDTVRSIGYVAGG